MLHRYALSLHIIPLARTWPRNWVLSHGQRRSSQKSGQSDGVLGWEKDGGRCVSSPRARLRPKFGLWWRRRGCAAKPGGIGRGVLMSSERQARPGQHAAVRARLGARGAAGGAGRRRELAKGWAHHGGDAGRATEACARAGNGQCHFIVASGEWERAVPSSRRDAPAVKSQYGDDIDMRACGREETRMDQRATGVRSWPTREGAPRGRGVCPESAAHGPAVAGLPWRAYGGVRRGASGWRRDARSRSGTSCFGATPFERDLLL
jgi:hypothetical protein